MPHGLDENERAVEHQRHDRSEYQLRGAVSRPEFRCRKVGKNERKAGERGENRELSARSLQLEALFAMARPAREQA